MKAEEKAKMIADQCKPCTDDFYSGIYQGVLIALKAESQSQPLEVKHPRSEQDEADRLVVLVSSISMSSLSECKVIAQVFTSEKITALQLRGLSTEFEEKVLTILKGM